jgi:hypothetical protein
LYFGSEVYDWQSSIFNQKNLQHVRSIAPWLEVEVEVEGI